jgi:hypothetical protein
VELAGVAIQRAAGLLDRFPQPLSALLDLASPALQDAHPRLGGGAAEEGQVNTEAVIGVVLRTGVGEEFVVPFPADRCQPVDAARSARGRALRNLLGDQPVGLHPAQRRVERTVGEGPERPEQARQPLTQLVTVHGRVQEQAEDRQFEHCRPHSLTMSTRQAERT